MHLPDLPDCQAYHRAVTDANFLECWVRHAAMTTYHPSGTCRMGENRFQDAVVNSDLRLVSRQTVKMYTHVSLILSIRLIYH